MDSGINLFADIFISGNEIAERGNLPKQRIVVANTRRCVAALVREHQV
jgi:hypothetical protein